MTEEANAREAIDNLERILQDAENAGLDVSRARQSQKIARNFFDIGKYHKVRIYCKMAEDNLG
jgi:ArsR family metal-binding transcriptional regulator